MLLLGPIDFTCKEQLNVSKLKKSKFSYYNYLEFNQFELPFQLSTLFFRTVLHVLRQQITNGRLPLLLLYSITVTSTMDLDLS